MATLKQVVDVLETLYPLRYAERWDEPGLIVGDLRRPVRGIALRLILLWRWLIQAIVRWC